MYLWMRHTHISVEESITKIVKHLVKVFPHITHHIFIREIINLTALKVHLSGVHVSPPPPEMYVNNLDWYITFILQCFRLLGSEMPASSRSHNIIIITCLHYISFFSFDDFLLLIKPPPHSHSRICFQWTPLRVARLRVSVPHLCFDFHTF